MKIALLGATGMLGAKIIEVFKAQHQELLTPSHSEVDLNQPHTLEKFFQTQSFDALVNCAAFTRVDACEEPAKFSMALNVNGTAVGWLAKFCKKTGRILVHYSTDYVFDGKKEEPYLEADPAAPINTYGRTKSQGEKLLFTENPHFYLVRSSWVYGPKGRNFVDTMVGLFKTRSRVEVVDDQVGGPTYTGDLAQFTWDLLSRKAPSGAYHFANSGYVSWYGFAKEIQKQTGLNRCEVVRVPSDRVFRPAERPANSRFDLTKATQALGQAPRPWQEALKDYLTKELQIEAA